MAIIKINNLGAAGYLPDVESSELPNNAFTYSRNWVYDEAGFAKIADGYTNAFINLENSTIGNASTVATFAYSWILSDVNTFFFYDSTGRRMKLAEAFDVESTAATAISAGQTTLSLTDASEFSTAGNGYVVAANGDLDSFTWTGKTGNSLTGIPATGDNALSAHASGVAVHDTTHNLTQVTLSAAVHANTVAHKWQATDAFGIPIFNNQDEHPWRYNDAGSGSVVALDNWPQNATCRYLTKTSAFLVALGYQDPDNTDISKRGGNRTVAFSDVIQTPGTYPKWDFDGENYNQVGGTSVTGNSATFAQTFDLSIYTDGDIVSGFEQNGIFYVNTTTNIVAFTYIGDGVWDATVLPFPNGVIGTRSSTPIPNGFFNIGNNRCYIHDGTSARMVGDGKWVTEFFNRLDGDRLDELQAVYDPRHNSVKILSPITETEKEVWIYNLDTDTMSVLSDHGNVEFMWFSADGVPRRDFTWQTFREDEWDELGEITWDSLPGTALGDFRNRVLSVGTNKCFVHDYGNTYDGEQILATLRREDLTFTESSYNSVRVDRIIPFVSADNDDAEIFIRLGKSDSPNSEITWTPYKAFKVETQRKQDWRFTANWLAVEVQTTAAGVKLSNLELKGRETGRR